MAMLPTKESQRRVVIYGGDENGRQVMLVVDRLFARVISFARVRQLSNDQSAACSAAANTFDRTVEKRQLFILFAYSNYNNTLKAAAHYIFICLIILYEYNIHAWRLYQIKRLGNVLNISCQIMRIIINVKLRLTNNTGRHNLIQWVRFSVRLHMLRSSLLIET